MNDVENAFETDVGFVLDVGELYIWGRDEGDGRLGLGPGRGPDHAGGLSIPCRVKELPYPVAAASCGGFFTMALTEDGQLWNWGGNCHLIYMTFPSIFGRRLANFFHPVLLVLEN